MRTFVSILTATTLLVHALVGCYAHCDRMPCASEQIASCESLVAGCCHHEGQSDRHHDDGPESETPLAPCGCTIACTTDCVSLPPERTTINAAHAALSIGVAIPAQTTTLNASAGGMLCGALRAAIPPEPPLRLHLVHQVILI